MSKSKTYMEASRQDKTFTFEKTLFERSDIESIIMNGSLMRIADSLEKISDLSAFTKIIIESEVRHQKKINSLKAQISILRTMVIKLSNKK